jgi:hypothetical protein
MSRPIQIGTLPVWELSGITFLRSLFWAAGFVVVLGWIALCTETIFVDFVHGNPHRPQQNAVVTLLTIGPVVNLILALELVIMFIISQFIQSISLSALLKYFGYRGLYAFAVLIPLGALVSWYCYDYLPSFELAINAGPDWTPYQHGLTLRRYLAVLGIQVAISVFSLMRSHVRAQGRGNAGIKLLLAVLAACAVVGVILGYRGALSQYQFL